MDCTPNNEEAENAFHTCVKWLVHYSYPDIKFVEKLANLRDYVISTAYR